jgi:hypothetical protein
MKEKFSQEEWELLKLLPFQVFIMAAGADGRIDKEEVAQLQKDFRDAPFYKDELHKELFIDILSSDINALIREAGNVTKLLERSSQMKAILKQKLTPEEYQRFLGSMFMNGVKVTRASGGGILGLGDKVSEEEKRALATFAATFELDLGNLSKLFEQ